MNQHVRDIVDYILQEDLFMGESLNYLDRIEREARQWWRLASDGRVIDFRTEPSFRDFYEEFRDIDPHSTLTEFYLHVYRAISAYIEQNREFLEWEDSLGSERDSERDSASESPEQNEQTRLLIQAQAQPVTLITRPFTYEVEPLSQHAYNYKNVYYQVNDLQSSIYAYNELLEWFQRSNTDPNTRAVVARIRKVKFVLPTIADSRGSKRRRSLGGGRRIHTYK